MDHRDLMWARSLRRTVAEQIGRLESGEREVQRWAGSEIDVTESTLTTLRARLAQIDKLLAAHGETP